MKATRFFSLAVSLSLIVLLFLCACAYESARSASHDDGAGDSHNPASSGGDDDTVSAADDDAAAPPQCAAVYDYFLIDGEPAPPNPVTGAVTPDKYNKVPLFRFHADCGGEPVPPVKAIVIFQAGFIAGANQMFFNARNLVMLSRGAFEVWIPERRHTLLEDQSIMDLAEQRKDPYLAYNYYLKGERVQGRKYHPLDSFGAETDMMSEWGLDLWMHDLRRVVELVPEDKRRTNVFLAGDSRGVAFTQAFAAYEFEDGKYGNDMLAGLILWDGGVRENPDLTESLYPLKIAGLRSGLVSRTVQNDDGSFWFMEIFGMIASEGMGDPADPALGPNGFFPDYGSFAPAVPLLERFHRVNLTNEAFVGLLFDSDYDPMPDYMGHLGRLTGGKIRHDILGDYPAEDGATYRWLRWDQCEPKELVDIQKLVRMLYEGPSNFSDFHYSTRLDIDLQAADFFQTKGTWRDQYFHFDTSRVDLPVFALVSKLYADLGLMEKYRGEVAPVRGAAGPRGEDDFKIIYMTEWSHLDAIAAEPAMNPVFPQLIGWINSWAVGTVPDNFGPGGK